LLAAIPGLCRLRRGYSEVAELRFRVAPAETGRGHEEEAVMTYDEFVQAIRAETHIESREEAEETAFVVLDALAERISGGEADDLYAQLPDPLKSRLQARVRRDEPARSMSAHEYVALVASRLGVSEEDAERRIRGVFDVVRRAVTQGEFDDVLSQLDSSYLGLAAPNAP
jgi:uncharacterized protein (DUF2267 family)